MQITIIAVADFHASCGPIEAGETIAVIETDQQLCVTRDLLALLRTGSDFEIDAKVEVGELLSLVRTGDKVLVESDDEAFEKDRDTESIERPQSEAPKKTPRRKKPAATATE